MQTGWVEAVDRRFLRSRDPDVRPAPLCVRRRDGWRLIEWSQVRYLQAEHKYVVIHHTHCEDLLDISLCNLELRFAERLLRIHRNCLVVKAAMSGLKRDRAGNVSVQLRDVAESLSVSRRRVPELRRWLRDSVTGRR